MLCHALRPLPHKGVSQEPPLMWPPLNHSSAHQSWSNMYYKGTWPYSLFLARETTLWEPRPARWSCTHKTSFPNSISQFKLACWSVPADTSPTTQCARKWGWGRWHPDWQKCLGGGAFLLACRAPCKSITSICGHIWPGEARISSTQPPPIRLWKLLRLEKRIHWFLHARQPW